MPSISSARILDFDTESRPSTYWQPDRPSGEVTAVAWSWVGQSKVHCALLGRAEDLSDERFSVYANSADVLAEFVDAYNEADIVTGHYITRHDLPIINGALIEWGLPILQPKLASDTKTHLMKRQDLPVSQEALAAYLEIKAPKVQMTQADWRDANRLTPTGLARTYKRVVGDVRQHKALRAGLIARGLLKAPRVWRP